jgi:hypothetical protein
VHEKEEFERITRMEEILEIINKDRINGDATQVQYTFINFEETLRKIQIDIFNKRHTEFCKYLSQFNLNEKLNLSHLFLARMIN